MTRAVFLDRDGVINQKQPEGRYVTRWTEFRFLPAAFEAIALLNRTGFSAIVVTNQRCVARGLIGAHELELLHSRMCSELKLAGAFITEVYYCPHDTQPSCICRKPAPGMLLQAAQDHEIDLGNSWMIGDSAADIEAGRRAGCKTAFIGTPGETAASLRPDVVGVSLLEVAGRIVALEGSESQGSRASGGYSG
jgi:D-glycero-D-manno-heptose 1,7-bisphosphate phosphatase